MTPEGSTTYPVEVLSDDETCRIKIWDAKAKNADGVEVGGYVIKTYKHHWRWLAVGNQLTNVRICGTCGHKQTIPALRELTAVPAFNGRRTEQEP